MNRLHTFAGGARSAIEHIVDQAFVTGLRGVMILSTVLCVVCVWPALWGRTKPAPAAEGEHPSVAHPLWAHLWARRLVPSEPAGV